MPNQPRVSEKELVMLRKAKMSLEDAEKYYWPLILDLQDAREELRASVMFYDKTNTVTLENSKARALVDNKLKKKYGWDR